MVGNQNEHKTLHKKTQDHSGGTTGFYNPFPNFSFAGAVRPVYPLSANRTVPKSIAQPDYAKTGIPKSERFANSTKVDILDAKGQEAMRKVCRLAREVLDTVAAEVRPGVTIDYLDEVCHKACIERDVSAYDPKPHTSHLLTCLEVLPFALELQSFPQIDLYFPERGHLPRDTRPANTPGWRYNQPRRQYLP